MRNDNNLFVRVNYTIKGREFHGKWHGTQIRISDKKEAAKYLIGGGYCNKYGGSFAFTAKDINEAKLIANNIPFVKNKIYKYEMLIYNKKNEIA